jgi:MFS family permease
VSSEIVLIIAKVVQGLGAAMASATGLSILAAAFSEGKERNRAPFYEEGQYLEQMQWACFSLRRL